MRQSLKIKEKKGNTPLKPAWVLAYFPQFSPNFEVLEIQAFVTVFDQSLKVGADPVYSNFLLYQSKLHAGLYAKDTRGEMEGLIELRQQHLMEVEVKNGRGTLDAHEKMELRDQAKRQSYYFYRAYSDLLDNHDPDGTFWLEEDGSHMLAALNEGLTEVVRLAVYDINGGIHKESDTEEALPGTKKKMTFLEEISLPNRKIYRDPDGGLISIDSLSRFVLLDVNM